MPEGGVSLPKRAIMEKPEKLDPLTESKYRECLIEFENLLAEYKESNQNLEEENIQLKGLIIEIYQKIKGYALS